MPNDDSQHTTMTVVPEPAADALDDLLDDDIEDGHLDGRRRAGVIVGVPHSQHINSCLVRIDAPSTAAREWAAVRSQLPLAAH